MSKNIHIFAQATDVAIAIAEKLNAKIEASNGNFNLAVSGGSTPRLLFEVLSKNYAERINWKKMQLFWVDERCVEPTHAESNFRMTYDSLLKSGLLSENQIFRMHGENTPTNETERYAEVLKQNLILKNNLPAFDMILLGIGDDGHTASIFPNQLHLLTTDAWVAVGTHPLSEQKRITLTGKTLNNATEILFMVIGTNKAEVIKQIIRCEEAASNYPANFIRGNEKSTHYFMDNEAAHLL